MGIDLPAFEFLLKANAEFGDFGKTVVLGRQRLLIRSDAERARFGAALQQYRPDLSLADIDDENVDRLIKALGGDPYQVMDNSAYEGAEVIHDLNEPLPAKYKSAFDTVIDVGTLEHVFNIATAMKSMAEAVRPGGQFLCLNIANNHLGHGFWQFSPEVFFRTFCPAHGYEARIADLHYHGQFHPLQDPQTAGQRLPIKTPGYTYITFGARKTGERPIFENGWPVQADYVAAWTLFLARNAERDGDFDQAERILRKAHAEASDNPAYMAALAGVLRRSGRQSLPEYGALMEAAARLAPELPILLNEQEQGKKTPVAAPPPKPKPKPKPATKRIDIGTIHLALDDERVPEKTRDAMIRGRYEFKEREVGRRMLGKGDRVIELGAGMGVVSLTIAKLVGADAIRSFEANPVILSLARENAAANDLPVDLRHAIASPRVLAEKTPHIDFFVMNSFEASSTRQVSPSQKPVKVPTTPLEDQIADLGANALVFDIEGFETEIIEKTDLSGIDKLILEIHPKILGMDICMGLIDRLEDQGLTMRKDLAFGDVLAFERGAPAAEAGGAQLFQTIADIEPLVQEGELAEALALADTIKDDVKENAYVHHRLAHIERAAGKAILRRLERAYRLGSKDFHLQTDLAGVYLERGKLKKAKAMTAELETLFPRSPALPALRARVKD